MTWRTELRRDAVWLALLVVFTASVRVAWIIHADVLPFDGLDTYFYDQTARRLASGLGYTHPADSQPTALFPPGYSFFLAAVYKVFWPSVAVAQTLSVLTSVGVALATYALGRIAIGRGVGLAGAFVWAAFPSQVFWTSLIMPEMAFTFAMMLSIALVFVAGNVESARGRLVLMVLAGALSGAALLIRGQAIGVWLVVGLWLLWFRRRDALVGTLAFALAMGLVVLPWTIRNERELHATVPISTNVGWNAVIGHADNANGGFWSPAAAGTFNAYIAPNPQGEVDRNEAGVRMARRWAREHPRDEIALSAKKVAILWNTDDDAIYWQQIGRVPDFMGAREYDALRYVCDVFYYAALAMGVFGVASGLKRSEAWAGLWVLIALYWTAFHVLFFSENRYHYPLIPLIALAAVVGGRELFRMAGLAPADPRTGRPLRHR
jgi:4-amino-4-deoxy-L-arabinose transferase-like glycosyltransferase